MTKDERIDSLFKYISTLVGELDSLRERVAYLENQDYRRIKAEASPWVVPVWRKAMGKK